MTKVLRQVPLVGLLLTVAACGGDQSVASKSAAAYREAVAKGTPIASGHDHGGHDAPGSATAVEHNAHDSSATIDASDHRGHSAAAGEHSTAGHNDDHSAMGHAPSSGAHTGHGMTTAGTESEHREHSSGESRGGDHAQHGSMQHDAATQAHAGHKQSTESEAHAQHQSSPAGANAQHAADAHAQHQPQPASSAGADARLGAAPGEPHAGHPGSAPPPPASASTPLSSKGVERLEPSSTLAPDAFDAPAPEALSEAAKAKSGGGHEAHQSSQTTPGEDHDH